MATQTETLNTPKRARFEVSSKYLHCNLVTKVRVIVRVRPFLLSEIESKGGNPIPCVSVVSPENGSDQEVSVYLKDYETSRNECYKLDSFYGQENDNVSQIFQKEVSPLIPGIFDGRNATIFAYGATGSGKTFTMQGTDELPGLMPLTMSEVLSLCERTGCSAEISYYEVYLDRCHDLLEPKVKEISVLEDKDGQVQLRGLSRVPVASMSNFHQIFSSGVQRRKVAHTSLNDVSSRSHGVLVILVSTPSGDGSGNVVKGKLNLIDLAGNEDNRKTCNEGIRLQESAKINQSLFALSNVIYALNNNKARVPYRESKLTRILQDSLGGKSRSLMVACLNPGEYQESVNTVSLAARSRQISNYVPSAQKQNTPNVKIDMEAKLRAWLESKGKTKNTQRSGAFASPLLSKTPNSLSSVKKPSLHQSSAKAKPTDNQGLSNAKERNPAAGAEASLMEEKILHKMNDSNLFSVTKDDGSTIAMDDSSKDCSIGPLHADIQYNINNQGVKDHIENNDTDSGKTSSLKSETYHPGGCLSEGKTTIPCNNSVGSPLIDESFHKEYKTTILSESLESIPVSQRIRALQNSLRKVLSPIHSNIKANTIENLSSKDRICFVLFEPETPKTPLDSSQLTVTPLDKFNTQSANLKASLVEEYLAFLNSATREELQRLKGIGQKRAGYILQLRETSPLKSLCDLEKIGLSSKQVHDMFRKAARGIFD
uniref:Kinesin-like protein n=1 Tax=Nelumbo nucifera TaxID=4432 RepID=A0A822Z6S0_NELNU|nr:TPA_asm: hypothetical protein HUJ06_012988 [Nelumbo nucifera]